jgi:hypothetical protein
MGWYSHWWISAWHGLREIWRREREGTKRSEKEEDQKKEWFGLVHQTIHAGGEWEKMARNGNELPVQGIGKHPPV